MTRRHPETFAGLLVVALGCGADPGAPGDSESDGNAQPGSGGGDPSEGSGGQSASGGGPDSGGRQAADGGGSIGSGGLSVETGGSGPSGGGAAVGGAGVGGTGVGGTAAGGAAAGGATSDGGAVGDFWGVSCPPGPHPELPFAASMQAVRIEGALPQDGFVEGDQNLVIVEGPVWRDGALYFSQIDNGPGAGGPVIEPEPSVPPKSRILRLTADEQGVVARADSGSNGLAIDPGGELAMCTHASGSVQRVSLEDGSLTALVSEYMGERFNSPNDLAFGPDGSLFFSDPDYQAPSPRPQPGTFVYRVLPGSSEALPVIEDRTQPNGITFSPDGSVLYLSSSEGVFSYPVLADGSLGEGARFASGVVTSGDGMGMDCAGNLYVTSDQSLVVLDPTGNELVRLAIPGVQSVTNVAFGGPERSTLYITALGTESSGTSAGLFRVASAISGMPY